MRLRAARNDDGEMMGGRLLKGPSDGFLDKKKEAFLDDRAESWRPLCDIKSRPGR